MKVQYEIDVEHDLFPVCPNCHAMLHRKKGSTLSIEELKQIIQQNNG
jgi:5-methylcytosine-specific restriction protein A